MHRSFAAFVAAALGAATIPIHAQMTEEAAKQAAQEVRLLITEGTNVIGDLQPAINGGKTTKEQVAPEALVDQFKARMDELRAQAGCVFIVSHSLDTIRNMCTRVIWLDKGELIMDGSTEETTNLYQEFSSNLSKGNNITAARIKDEARANLVATQIMERSSGRRMEGR